MKPATLIHPMGSMGEEVQPAQIRFWEHFCSDGGLTGTAAGESCSWCQATEASVQRAKTRGAIGSAPWDYSAGEAA